MDCSQFKPEQVEHLLAVVMRQRNYLTRLIERMRIRRFPPDDPDDTDTSTHREQAQRDTMRRTEQVFHDLQGGGRGFKSLSAHAGCHCTHRCKGCGQSRWQPVLP